MRTYAEEARKAFGSSREGPWAHAMPFSASRWPTSVGRRKPSGRGAGVALDADLEGCRRGPYFQHQLVRIHMLGGDPEKALDLLEPLLRSRTPLARLAPIDPNFDPLRRNPRFEKLAAGK